MRFTALPNLQVLNLAESFYSAAEILKDNRSNAIPIINLRCHAIELYLKALHLKDTATDFGDGVALLRPNSGRGAGHQLGNSFTNALPEHQKELLSGMPRLNEELALLEGIFRRSRYIYENGDSLPFSTAEHVARYLACRIPQLTPIPVRIDQIASEDRK
jgi:hypothetical protein